MSAPCASWCCRCTSYDGRALPKLVLPMPLHGQRVSSICIKDGVLSVWILSEDMDAEQLATTQLYCLTAELGRAHACYDKGWSSGRRSSWKKLRRVLKSTLHGCRASTLTRCDTVCLRPSKCLLESINTLKYSFILFIFFHAWLTCCLTLLHAYTRGMFYALCVCLVCFILRSKMFMAKLMIVCVCFHIT